MTTPQPAALPELPHTTYSLFYEQPGDLEDEGYQYVLDEPGYTAAQMRAYALATLQAQPAEVSDEAISIAAAPFAWKNLNVTEHRNAFARAILALRPQAESDARRAAQEQLYTERERHTAEVKRLQAEIGRLQSLRPQAVPMTDAWAAGVQAAADLLKRMADETALERGETDPDTGAIQFKSAATREWHASLCELAEEIERLKPAHHGITAPAGGEGV